MARPFRWTRQMINIRDLLENPDKPRTVPQVKAFLRKSCEDAAKDEGWRMSELACTIAVNDEDVERVVAQLQKTGRV